MRLVLASQSPSRLSILRGAGVEPVIAPAHVDERAIEERLAGGEPAEIVCALAAAKEEATASHYSADVVGGGGC
ncbi:Maf family protein, partial [uncultured Corynebacterium sp.]|uniref:Maf family protein n=1 Tax=uncultured Corynebacterium sp. TaxID=159447 RepID=UPI002805DF99